MLTGLTRSDLLYTSLFMDSVQLDTSVTALKCLKFPDSSLALIIGIGNLLEIHSLYDVRSDDKKTDIILRKKIFRSSTSSIHGFTVAKEPSVSGDGKMAATVVSYGAKELVAFRLIRICSEKFLVDVLFWLNCEDWIFDVRWDFNENDCPIAVLMGHNKVIEYEVIEVGETICKKIREIACEEKCILYSGVILDDMRDGRTVLAGTVFQEVVIWRVGRQGKEDCGVVLHRLQGHEGVIFSVTFDYNTLLICSTSDDRTARLWKVTPRTAIIPHNWSDVDISVHAVLQGRHSSRIFKCCFLNYFLQEVVGTIVVTCGEDSVINLWNASTGEFLARRKHDNESGSALRCVDSTYIEHLQVATVFTGSGNSSVMKWCFTPEKLVSGRRCEKDIVGEIIEPDYPKVLRHYNSNILLCLSNLGLVYAFCTPDESFVLLQDEDLRNYSLMEVCPALNLVSFATLCGRVKVHRICTGGPAVLCCVLVADIKMFECKILAMSWVSDGNILVCGDHGLLLMAQYLEGSNNDEVKVLKEFRKVLPLCREGHRWFTVAVFNEGVNSLIVGDRMGNLHVYDMKQQSKEDPIRTVWKIHNHLGVADLKIINNKIYTVGRDGYVRTFECNSASASLRQVSSSILLKKISHPEKLLSFKDGKNLFVLGFRSNRFLVYNLGEGQIIWETVCGGSHRSWSYHICNMFSSSSSSSRFYFAYIKDGRVLREVFEFGGVGGVVTSSNVLRQPLHSRQISCVHHILSLSGSVYLATAGEDTVIKIHRMDAKETFRLVRQHLFTLSGHISSVKCLDSRRIAGNDVKVLLISAGGRAQLKVWEITIGNDVLAREVSSHMLMGNDKERRRKNWKLSDLQIENTETRYMDIKFLKKGEVMELDVFLVAAACSDGVLRLLKCDLLSKKVQVLIESAVHTHTFQKLFIDEAEQAIYTTSTDGKLRIWNTDWKSSTVSELLSLQMHQSGINAINSTAHWLLTGGDDGGVSKFKMKSKEVVPFSHVHAAQITGLCGIPGTGELFATTSADQRIAIWQTSSTSAEHLEHVAMKFCSIPDVQDMAVFVDTENPRLTYITVVGIGMQTFVLRPKNHP